MRRTKFIAFILLAMTIQTTSVFSLDLGRALRSAAGQVIDNAVRGASQPPPQQYQSYSQPQPQQQQQTQTYSYEEYMAAQNEASNTGTTSVEASDSSQNIISQTEDNDFDVNNPFAGLVEDENNQPSANAGSDSDAQESDTIEVIATGIGQDSDQALKNALRAAIEQAVGTMVDSETLANNDEVVNDQILSYSAGFVESHKVIGEPRTRDGLVTIKIQAQVKRTQLAEKLKAASIHIKEVDGESLFGEAITKMEQKASAVDVALKAIEGFPENIIEAKLAEKPKYDDASKRIILEIEVAVDMNKYREFYRMITKTFEKISDRHQQNSIAHTVDESHVFLVHPKSRDMIVMDASGKNAVFVNRSLNEARTNGTWDIYYLPFDTYKMLVRYLKRPKLVISIIDKDENILVSGTYDVATPFTNRSALAPDSMLQNPIVISPLLDDDPRGDLAGIAPGRYQIRYNVAFDVSPGELKQMRNVVCKISKGDSL